MVQNVYCQADNMDVFSSNMIRKIFDTVYKKVVFSYFNHWNSIYPMAEGYTSSTCKSMIYSKIAYNDLFILNKVW